MRLRSLAGTRLRPTSARVCQALFDVLRARLPDAIFVDLFAGTGSVGLTALREGARQAYFVEGDRRVLKVLQHNLSRYAVPGRAVLIAARLPEGVRQLPPHLQADVLFLDPPYASDLGERTLAALATTDVLAPGGVVVWQHAADHRVPEAVLGRPLRLRRRYGETQLSLYAA
ncbi:MAG: methyltransferase small [Candidatus Tectimicrobiota bacterium]|nr:MAG: methyltransferase small [Candidatus Tectomicrobia bacterium]